MLWHFVKQSKFAKPYSVLILIIISLSVPVNADVAIQGSLGIEMVDTDNPEKCLEGIYHWDSDICLIWNAAFHKNEKFCDIISQDDSKVYCYHLLAVYSKNKEICSKTGIYEEYCKTEVQAIQDQNPLLCEDMENPRNCYEYISQVFGDEELCYKSYSPQQCLLNLLQKEKGMEACKNLKGEIDNSFCYAYFSIREKKTEICESADTPDQCYWNVAIELLDLESCSKAGYEEENCKERVIMSQAIKDNNMDKCEDTGTSKGNCYDAFALKRDDQEICKKSDWEENCLELLSKKKTAKMLDSEIDSFQATSNSKTPILYIISGIILVILISIFIIIKRNSKKPN